MLLGGHDPVSYTRKGGPKRDFSVTQPFYLAVLSFAMPTLSLGQPTETPSSHYQDIKALTSLHISTSQS